MATTIPSATSTLELLKNLRAVSHSKFLKINARKSIVLSSNFLGTSGCLHSFSQVRSFRELVSFQNDKLKISDKFVAPVSNLNRPIPPTFPPQPREIEESDKNSGNEKLSNSSSNSVPLEPRNSSNPPYGSGTLNENSEKLRRAGDYHRGEDDKDEDEDDYLYGRRVAPGVRIAKILKVPDGMALGVLFGVKGSNIIEVKQRSGADCHVDRETREIAISGTRSQVHAAVQILQAQFTAHKNGRILGFNPRYTHPKEAHTVFSPEFQEDCIVSLLRFENQFQKDKAVYKFVLSENSGKNFAASDNSEENETPSQLNSKKYYSPREKEEEVFDFSLQGSEPALSEEEERMGGRRIRRGGEMVVDKAELVASKRFHSYGLKKELLERMTLAGRQALQISAYDHVEVEFGFGNLFFYNFTPPVLERRNQVGGIPFQELKNMKVGYGHAMRCTFSNMHTNIQVSKIQKILMEKFNFELVERRNTLSFYIKDNQKFTYVRVNADIKSTWVKVSRIKSTKEKNVFIAFVDHQGDMEFRFKQTAHFLHNRKGGYISRDWWSVAERCAWSEDEPTVVEIHPNDQPRFSVESVRYKQIHVLKGTLPQAGPSSNIGEIVIEISRVEDDHGTHWEVEGTCPELCSKESWLSDSCPQRLSTLMDFCEEVCDCLVQENERMGEREREKQGEEGGERASLTAGKGWRKLQGEIEEEGKILDIGGST